MREYELRLEFAVNLGQPKQRFLSGTHRIIAQIKDGLGA